MSQRKKRGEQPSAAVSRKDGIDRTRLPARVVNILKSFGYFSQSAVMVDVLSESEFAPSGLLGKKGTEAVRSWAKRKKRSVSPTTPKVDALPFYPPSRNRRMRAAASVVGRL